MILVRCTASALNLRSLPEVAADTLIGKRMVAGQQARAVGTSFGLADKWLYVDSPAGRGWASARYLEDLGTEDDLTLLDPAWPKIPNGLAEIVRIYGQAGSAPCSAGRVTLPAPLKLGWVDQTVTVVACHKLLEDVLESVFAQIYIKGLWPQIATFDGIYNSRTITRSQKISVHSWGLGVDLNASTNRQGSKPTMDLRIVAIFKDHGFIWGGDWTGRSVDGMHFQRVTGY